jgi:hypothetical protein
MSRINLEKAVAFILAGLAALIAVAIVVVSNIQPQERPLPTLMVLPSPVLTLIPVQLVSNEPGGVTVVARVLLPVISATPTVTVTPSITPTASITPPITFSATSALTATIAASLTTIPTATVTPTITPVPTLDMNAPEYQAVVHTADTVYTGPGGTHKPIKVLNARETVRILERNSIGNWVHILHRLRVNTTVPDADANGYEGGEIAALYQAPVIPNISPEMREVYMNGLALGNHGNAITKVGDSVTANRIYLTPMILGNQELGPYDYLDETIRYFGASLEPDSVAARKGLSSFGVFDPLYAIRECDPNESPLACEYRIKKPSVAFIMFGPNDIWQMEADEFEAQMRLLVQETLMRGIIPVLTTFSTDPRKNSWEPSIDFNVAVINIAHDYHVPVMNLWLAARDLPGYGLEGDGIHMKNYGYNQIKFDIGLEARFGVNLQNLVAIRTLDEIRRSVMMP